MTTNLSFTKLTSTLQLTQEDTSMILRVAKEMEEVLRKGGDQRLEGKILASLFYEPSTRTRLSFETAMLRLGGQIISTEGFQFSSLYKGETIEDTIRVVGSYADIICMRHPEQGSADRAAAVSPVPFLNAGDGPGQHPTQALLDLFTIEKECGRLENLHIAMAGDLRYGRTVHSLVVLLGLYERIRFTFIAPKELSLPEKVVRFINERGLPYEESEDLASGLHCDVLYMTRVQAERFTDHGEYLRLKDYYNINATILNQRRPIIMHPLPRVGEISEDVDILENAAYFRQASNGVPVRMALLSLLLARP